MPRRRRRRLAARKSLPSAVTSQSATGLAQSKTLRADQGSLADAPASWTAAALRRYSPAPSSRDIPAKQSCGFNLASEWGQANKDVPDFIRLPPFACHCFDWHSERFRLQLAAQAAAWACTNPCRARVAIEYFGVIRSSENQTATSSSLTLSSVACCFSSSSVRKRLAANPASTPRLLVGL